MQSTGQKKMHNGTHHIFTRILPVIIAAVFFAGCSTTGEMISWFKFWDSTPDMTEVTEKDMTRFASTIRPVRGNPDSHYLLGNHYQKRGMHKEAIEEYRKVIIIDPSYVKAYNALGVSHDRTGHFEEAVVYYKTALNLNPDLDYVQNNLGYSYYKQAKLDEAIAAFQKAIELDSEDKRFHNNLGLTYARKGDYQNAYLQFRLAGNEARALYNLGQVYYQKGHYEQAGNYFLKALSVNPSFTLARSWWELASAMSTIYDSTVSEAADEVIIEADTSAVEEDNALSTDSENLVVKKHSINPVNEVRGTEESASPKTHSAARETDVQWSPPHLRNAAGKDVVIRPVTQDSTLVEMTGIEISNGNGVNRMATRMGTYLNQKGLNVTRLTNADNFEHPRTVIYYRGGHLRTAYEVAQNIPGFQDMDKSARFDRPDINVRVLIGKDVVKYNDMFVGG